MPSCFDAAQRRPAFLLVLALALCAPAAGAQKGTNGDWPDWRGPARDGLSPETGLPEKWSPAGQNLAWKAPYGGRSAPVVLGDHLYLLTARGKGDTLQERLLCLHTETGKLLWEQRWSVFMSDVPPHRIAWASPAADPQTGNVYVFGVGGMLLGFTREGKKLWERSLTEEFGLITTHGGRTVSPVIEGDLVIVSGISAGWGTQGAGLHRFFAFDKRSGETMWVSSPGGRPYDTTYSAPIVVVVNAVRLLIAGASDGAYHALKVQTGEPVWKYVVSKRGINTGAILIGTNAVLTHSEENMDTSDMGMIAAVDATAKGTLGAQHLRWRVNGFQGGFSSPVSDGKTIYQVDNGANLFAFDAATGKQLWVRNLGTIQKASAVLADGKLYVGTENGKFFILRPRADGCDILDEEQLGTEAAPEAVIGSVAIAHGKVFVVSSEALYAIGKKTSAAPTKMPPAMFGPGAAGGAPAYVQVVPAEVILKPGERVRLRARLINDRGDFVGESKAAWSLEQLGGTVQPDGTYAAPADAKTQGGQVKATVGQLSGTARVRIFAPLPWTDDFQSTAINTLPGPWVNAVNKYAVRELDGGKVLVKLAENQFSLVKRARAFIGPNDWSNYTIEADVRSSTKRRQMGDVGIVAQRYQLVLFGNHEKLELQSWQPETARTVSIAYPWKPDTWYHLKLRVENLPDGKVRARGKVWPTGEAEPAEWTIERIDPLGHRQGAPGLYGDAIVEVYFDNLKITPNSGKPE